MALAIDETDSNDAQRTWRKSNGSVCYTHAEDTPALLTQDVEPIALGADCSMLRVLFGLLVLTAPVNE